MAVAITSTNGRENRGGGSELLSRPLFRKAASGIARACALR